jgi:hypothetical protein
MALLAMMVGERPCVDCIDNVDENFAAGLALVVGLLQPLVPSFD